MEQQPNNISDSETPNILSLPTEVLLYILQLLSDVRDRVKLRYVSRRLKSISETPSLWREFVWPYYNYRDKECLYSLLRSCGEHVQRLSFPQHVMPTLKNMYSTAANRTPGIVSMLHFCSNLTHLILSAEFEPDLLSKLKEVVQNMNRLEVLDIYVPHRSISSERFVIQTDNTFQMLFNLSAKLSKLTIRLEISIQLQLKDFQSWIIQGFNPPKLNIFVSRTILKYDLLCTWAQWNSQVPAGHTACLRIYNHSKPPLDLFYELPVFQLQYGQTATLPFMRASSVGLLGLTKDLLSLSGEELITNGTENE